MQACELVYPSIKSALGAWWNEVTFGGSNAEAGYTHGKLVFDVVSMFIGVGEVKGFLKAGKLADEAAALIRQGIEEAGEALGQKAGKQDWLKFIKEDIDFEETYFTNLSKTLDPICQKLVRRLSFEGSDETRAVIDGVTVNGDGSLVLIETKLRGSTQFTKRQKKVYAEIETGTAKAVGGNAAKARIEGKTIKAEVKRVNKYEED
ncbi:MAG: hypothetical protein MUF62_08775 [Chitinophagaceae bacterium]|nr:hypothetical protein [Chitinophagaceae bacterium]